MCPATGSLCGPRLAGGDSLARELTREEKKKIRALVVKWCANYDKEYGCLPLECECYMFGKCWTGAYCRYFREAVLPLDPALEAALLTEGPRPDFKPCPICGGAVPADVYLVFLYQKLKHHNHYNYFLCYIHLLLISQWRYLYLHILNPVSYTHLKIWRIYLFRNWI